MQGSQELTYLPWSGKPVWEVVRNCADRPTEWLPQQNSSLRIMQTCQKNGARIWWRVCIASSSRQRIRCFTCNNSSLEKQSKRDS